VNIPKAIEVALAGILRGTELGSGVVVRSWQAMRRDGSWDADVDREFPLVDIRFAPERTNEDQATMVSEGVLLCATTAEDDRDHAIVSALYEAVHDVLRGIWLAFMTDTGTAYTGFVAAVEAEEPGFQIGGVTFSDPTPPYDDGGANMIGVGFAVHFSYVAR